VGCFAGLDVSLEGTAICIVDDGGHIVREARVASEPEALTAFLGASGMEMERVGLEAWSLTAWLHAALTEAGVPVVCIEARQAKAAMGAMPNKTDRNDARGIAQIMRTGWYRAVHLKSPSCRSWRALLPARLVHEPTMTSTISVKAKVRRDTYNSNQLNRYEGADSWRIP
jgi:transposase